jgi:hypothetical protein
MRDVGLDLLFVAIRCSEVWAQFLAGSKIRPSKNDFDASVLKLQDVDRRQIEPDNEHRRRRG